MPAKVNAHKVVKSAWKIENGLGSCSGIFGFPDTCIKESSLAGRSQNKFE